MSNYAKIIVKGSPITKSNFKLFNTNGRAILPSNTGKYHDRYANYEQQIAYEARIQNPNIVFKESLIALLKVYYKSDKRHPDTNNITKSIFDGVEKSGLFINDIQIRRIIIEEFYDRENPRFELELFAESMYNINYSIDSLEIPKEKILYSFSSTNIESKSIKHINKKQKNVVSSINSKNCSICDKPIKGCEYITANKGKTLICRKCLSKTF